MGGSTSALHEHWILAICTARKGHLPSNIGYDEICACTVLLAAEVGEPLLPHTC